jgi:hypothetical protein
MLEQTVEHCSFKPGVSRPGWHSPVEGRGLTLVTALSKSESAQRGWIEVP